jgi:MFS family permease
MVIAAVIACIIAPAYLTANDLTSIMAGFVIQGAFGGSLLAICPSYLSERFPTEVRSTRHPARTIALLEERVIV